MPYSSFLLFILTFYSDASILQQSAIFYRALRAFQFQLLITGLLKGVIEARLIFSENSLVAAYYHLRKNYTFYTDISREIALPSNANFRLL